MNRKKKIKFEKNSYYHGDGWSTKKTLTMDYDRGGVRPTWV